MNQTMRTYAGRCRQWLLAGENVTVQTVANTIEKFSRQLDQLDDQQSELADDLLETLDMLSDYLVQIELLQKELIQKELMQGLPPAELNTVVVSEITIHEMRMNTSAANDLVAVAVNPAVLQSVATDNVIFDPSPLLYYDDKQPAPQLTATERQAKLAELLATGAVSRGFPPAKKS